MTYLKKKIYDYNIRYARSFCSPKLARRFIVSLERMHSIQEITFIVIRLAIRQLQRQFVMKTNALTLDNRNAPSINNNALRTSVPNICLASLVVCSWWPAGSDYLYKCVIICL